MNKQQQQIDSGLWVGEGEWSGEAGGCGGCGGVAEGREEHNTGTGLRSIIIARFILRELPQS